METLPPRTIPWHHGLFCLILQSSKVDISLNVNRKRYWFFFFFVLLTFLASVNYWEFLYSAFMLSPLCKYGLKSHRVKTVICFFYYSVEHSEENKVILPVTIPLSVASTARLNIWGGLLTFTVDIKDYFSFVHGIQQLLNFFSISISSIMEKLLFCFSTHL